ncbi:MAG: DUF1028 domain-containing protein [Anaerolineales bacterium]|nr:DUF1028 domain-containing protein [Anaerolineales bacterium]
MPRLSTFSIAAFDPDDGAWGVAVASKFPAVGAVVPWAKSGAGAVATQAMGNTSFGARGLEMMAAGRSAPETLEALLADDVGREHRQVGAVDAAGQAATFTGKECLAWAGGRTGEHFAIQGNILTGPEVVDAMAQAFRPDSGDLADRLMAALLAGDRAGGDRRGRQSAALFVVKPQAGYGGFNDIWLDYRVDDDPDPVPRLVELLAIHRLYFGKSPADDQIPIAGEVATQLQRIMASLGYYGGPVSGAYDETTRSALMAFIGNENFEDRTDFAAGQIDRPVFDYLLRKFGG